MDKEILELLQDMQNNINKRFDIIEAGQEELKASQKEISLRIDDISKGIGKLVADEIGESISSVKEEVKEIKKNVEEISEKVNGIEGVTMKNCYDIAKIKVVK